MFHNLNDKTTITLTDAYGTYTVSTNKIDMTIYDVVEDLIKPVLLASGYFPNLVDKALGLHDE